MRPTIPHPNEPITERLYEALRTEAAQRPEELPSLTASLPPWELLAPWDRLTWCRWAYAAQRICLEELLHTQPR